MPEQYFIYETREFDMCGFLEHHVKKKKKKKLDGIIVKWDPRFVSNQVSQILTQFNNICLPGHFLRRQTKKKSEKGFEQFEIKYCPKMTLSTSN